MPAADVVAFAMKGSFSSDVKSFGPLQFQVTASPPVSVNLIVSFSHTGELLPAIASIEQLLLLYTINKSTFGPSPSAVNLMTLSPEETEILR